VDHNLLLRHTSVQRRTAFFYTRDPKFLATFRRRPKSILVISVTFLFYVSIALNKFWNTTCIKIMRVGNFALYS